VLISWEFLTKSFSRKILFLKWQWSVFYGNREYMLHTDFLVEMMGIQNKMDPKDPKITQELTAKL
jgi:hypothetical protein